MLCLDYIEVTDTSFELPELNRALLKWELVYDTVRPSHARDYLTQKVSANVTYDPWLPKEFQYCDECVGATPPPTVPTVDHWGIAAMITLFAGLLVWTVRRRRLASRTSH